MNKSMRLRVAIGAALLAMVLVAWGAFARPFQRRIVHELTSAPSALVTPYLLEQRPDAVRYRLFRDKGEEVSVPLGGTPESIASTQVVVRSPAQDRAEVYPAPPFRISPALTDRGEFFLDFRFSQLPPTKIEIAFSRTRTGCSPSSLLFFTLLCGVVWFTLIYFLLPVKWAPCHGRWQVLALIAVTALLVLDRHWWQSKDFDDQYAIGPAAALLHSGFDADRLYFRARVRPAVSAFTLPMQAVFPLQFASTSQWPTDGWRRWFDKYDRPNRFFATFLYLEYSVIALLVLVGSGFMIGRFVGEFGLSPSRQIVTTALVLLLLWHILDNVISFSFTTAMIWAAPVAAFWAMRHGTRSGFLIAGITAGAAVLAKETAVAIALPVAIVFLSYLYQDPSSPGIRSRKSRVGHLSLYAVSALALPLIYFLFIIHGGFGNLRELFAEHAAQMKLYPQSFRPLTVHEALNSLWEFAGPLPFTALAGVALAIRREGRVSLATGFFGAWFLGACSVFLSPYVLARFHVNLIPPLVWFNLRLLPSDWLCAKTVKKIPQVSDLIIR